MTRLALATLLVAAAFGPASAQYYYGPGYGPPPPGYGPPPPGYGYRPPPPRYGRRGGLCYTSRGECPVPAYTPPGSSCGCYIPGFGPKRGISG